MKEVTRYRLVEFVGPEELVEKQMHSSIGPTNYPDGANLGGIRIRGIELPCQPIITLAVVHFSKTVFVSLEEGVQ